MKIFKPINKGAINIWDRFVVIRCIGNLAFIAVEGHGTIEKANRSIEILTKHDRNNDRPDYYMVISKETYNRNLTK